MRENRSNSPRKSHSGLLNVAVFGGLKVFVIHLAASLFLLAWFLCKVVQSSQQVVLKNANDIVLTNLHLIEASQSSFRNTCLADFINSQQIAAVFINQVNIIGSSIIQESLQLIVVVIEIVLSRLFIFLMAMPLWMLVLLIGLTDGLVKRDIRKFQGARESTLTFHRAKRFLGVCFFIPLFVYLACPWVVSPIWFLGTQIMLLGLMTAITITHFKKYL